MRGNKENLEGTHPSASILSFFIYGIRGHTEISVWKKQKAMIHEYKTLARYFVTIQHIAKL